MLILSWRLVYLFFSFDLCCLRLSIRIIISGWLLLHDLLILLISNIRVVLFLLLLGFLSGGLLLIIIALSLFLNGGRNLSNGLGLVFTV